MLLGSARVIKKFFEEFKIDVPLITDAFVKVKGPKETVEEACSILDNFSSVRNIYINFM